MDNAEKGRRIEMARTHAGITRRELAEIISVSPSTITRYEKGEFGRLKKAILDAIAKATGTNLAWLSGESDRMLSLSFEEHSEKTAEEFKESLSSLSSIREKQHMKQYKKLKDEYKDKVDKLTGALLDAQEQEETILFAAHHKDGVTSVNEHDRKIMEDDSEWEE